MSDDILRGLQRRNEELVSEVSRLNKEAKDRRIKGKGLASELEALKAQLTDLTSDRDGWKQKAEAAPGDLQGKIDELTGQIRVRDHRDAWKDAVGPLLHEKAGVEKLWAELGYTPGDTVPTAEEIATLLAPARESAPYLFRPEETGSAGSSGTHADSRESPTTARPPLQRAVSGGQGGPVTAPGRVRVTKAQMQDPGWKLDPKNKALIAEATKAGTLDVV